MKQIVETTDGKYLGLHVDVAESYFSFEDWTFIPTRVEHLEGGNVRLSTTSYVIVTKDIV